MSNLDKTPIATPTVKPPPIVIGVTGFSSSVVYKPDPAPIALAISKTMHDWDRIANLTTFAKYAKENNAQDIIHFIHAEIERYGEQGAYERYATWFYDTGLWVGETPTGELA
ncbi:hypothetical protein LP109_05460 [Moraxella bovis]|uniref:hypothetical protein n=1 Tax=Moraxella bovis TaxID=476 RepID=UPI000992DCBA|nr:hypothetical protein [Moraxella bovis]OOR87080.1 hypothetical protein B0182_13205 [Moraxella bovis]UZA17729.1 hypothetical protein LP109_05460 [Moraxella bovis]UZA18336.1 hypothetical protein LP088_08185 [Moraxella bovis]